MGLMVSYIFSRALIEKNLTNPKKGVIYAKPDRMELLDNGLLHFYCREFELYSRLARVSAVSYTHLTLPTTPYV